jgi:tRNA pseudouridine32 synthase/23S rRNA pseudouridine746 synthase
LVVPEAWQEQAMLADRILFLDGEAIVLDKPAGLPVTTPRAGGSSVEALAPAVLRFGFARPPTVVHRLDQDTSGCLVLARNAKAHRRFAAAFAAGEVAKTYLALLEAMPDGEEGIIDLPLAKKSSRAEGWRIVADRGGQPARTRWRLIDRVGDRALVAFMPETGRTHQLRVHAASGLGVPILGDPIYGRAGDGMRLHAWKLTVPRTGKPAIVAVAPPPSGFPPLAGDVADAA